MSGFGLPCTILAGLNVLDIPLLDGKAFSHSVAHATIAMTIIFGIFLYGRECVIVLQRSLTVQIDLSMIATCSSLPYMCSIAGKRNILTDFMSNSLSPCTADIPKPLAS